MKTETLTQINSGENQIVVYQPDETIRLDVRLENETVWLTQEQMSKLLEERNLSLRGTSATYLLKVNLTGKWYMQNLHTPLGMEQLLARLR